VVRRSSSSSKLPGSLLRRLVVTQAVHSVCALSSVLWHTLLVGSTSGQWVSEWVGWRWRRTFRAYDVKMMWLTSLWRFLGDNNCQSCLSLFNDSLQCTCNYCIDGSNWHFEFPKVVLARISGEVGTLCIVLLSVYSETCLPIFTEIGSYLTDTWQKISWHVFFETQCMWSFVYRDIGGKRKIVLQGKQNFFGY